MRKILIIGMGAGDPDYMTIQAIDAMNRVDVFFIPDKGEEKAGLRHLRTEMCQRFIEEPGYRLVEVAIPERGKPAHSSAQGGYRQTVDAWHAEIERRYEVAFRQELAEDEVGGFLIWGDPGLYDSTLRVVDRIFAKGFALEYDVIPGISSVQALAAKHRIPLNRIGEAVVVTPARKLAGALAAKADTVVVVLDGEQSFLSLDGEAFDIYWGAYLGTDDEILVAGRLSQVRDEIARRREDARRRIGWIMDTYLLRRR